MKVARLMLSMTVSAAALSKSCFNLQMVRMNLRKLFRLFLLPLPVHFVYAQQPQHIFFRVTLGSDMQQTEILSVLIRFRHNASNERLRKSDHFATTTVPDSSIGYRRRRAGTYFYLLCEMPALL
jgi:hypothetical protein